MALPGRSKGTVNVSSAMPEVKVRVINAITRVRGLGQLTGDLCTIDRGIVFPSETADHSIIWSPCWISSPILPLC